MGIVDSWTSLLIGLVLGWLVLPFVLALVAKRRTKLAAA